MYSTSDIAHLLGTKRTNVNYYIRKGHLKAEMVDGFYVITPKDYYSFRDTYFDSNLRFSARGPAKKLTDKQVELLSSIMPDLKNNHLSLEQFTNKYETIKENIPFFEKFIVYKRDICIRKERNLGVRYSKLSKKYKLSEKTVRNICNKEYI